VSDPSCTRYGRSAAPIRINRTSGRSTKLSKLNMPASLFRSRIGVVVLDRMGHGPTEGLAPDLAKEAAARLREAAEMGDMSGLTAIAEEMASRSEVFAPYQSKIAQPADDFNFEGILELANDLAKTPGWFFS